MNDEIELITGEYPKVAHVTQHRVNEQVVALGYRFVLFKLFG